MILLWIPVLIFAYIKMIDPGKKRKHPVLNVKYYAHRGFHGEEGIPENSMAAFKKAKGSGYGIELDVQLTKDGVEDFGYGIPYSTLNTDTLCNGKRRRVYGVWSPDSRHFAMTVSDDRAVKELWVINSMAQPRPTLETYKYKMPGEKEAP